MAGKKTVPSGVPNSNVESLPVKIHTNEGAEVDGSALSDPKMSGLRQKKAADGVNKKQCKSSKSSAAAASKDDGGTTSNKAAGSNSTAERYHSSAAAPQPSVSAAPAPSVRRG